MPADLTKPFSESCCDGGATTLNDMSAQSCGCDKGANHLCERHLRENRQEIPWINIETGETGTVFAPNVETEIESDKPSNPKDMVGSNKIPYHLWPQTASALGSLATLEGNLKYGRTNWRAAGVKASIYYDACLRHLCAWFDEGEDNDPDSGLPHLAHALACLAIIVDAGAAGKLTDDRLIRGGYRQFIDSITPHVARLKAKHADKNPRHYYIQDSEETE
jgi:hypothetical protein